MTIRLRKTVYEGNIYPRGLPSQAPIPTFAEAFNSEENIRREPVEEGKEEASAEYTVYGNDLYYNEKGYFTAFYYLGD